ncbi:MAG TPA: FAD-binding oxidoreductase [Anaerolineaceae bacterium]|nr:FAD-binding oxidoreductase [Anaerolineaceae bacterium]
MTEKKDFTPPWIEEAAPPHSYRSLFKWGNPNEFKHPNRGMFRLILDTFGMSEADFQQPLHTGWEEFDADFPVTMDAVHLQAFTNIVGVENIQTGTYERVRASYGAGMIDALRLRQHHIENLPDLVIAPRSTDDIRAIVQYCHQNRIPVYIYGAGSTVTRGMEAVRGGICLDMSRHMNRVVSFNEVDQTITVQAGMWGPELERILNQAPKILGASRAYTCGHFPQSFMHSSVGGWTVTRGAGQNSTYYGKIEDIVLSQEYITPLGDLKTPGYPRSATGPDFDQLMMGSEGCFGVLTTVTLRIFRFMPENTRRFSYLFHTWEEAQSVVREMMQAESGLPSVFRLSDPEETDVAMRMYHIHGSPADAVLQALDYQPMRRCLLLGSVDGDAGYTRLVARKIAAISRHHRAFPLTPFQVTRRWEKSRFTDPYLREDLMDFGVLIDTLECAVTWEQVPLVHARVREFVKSRPQTICMTHMSHMYPQGTNLYFIFIARITDINEYLALQYGVLEAIQQSGAAMSHHHGIGKQTAPWLEDQIGTACMDVIRVLKRHFDPNGIMNPGGTLGLDMSEEQRSRRWGMRT